MESAKTSLITLPQLKLMQSYSRIWMFTKVTAISIFKEIKAKAMDLGIELHTGTTSICPTSKTFNMRFGTAEEHLESLIQVARRVGSPVTRCYQGNFQDRSEPWRNRIHMKNTLQVLKKAKSQAIDAGVENCCRKPCRRHASLGGSHFN